MIRALIWIVALAALVAASVWFADRPGTVTLHWQGWRVDTSVAFLVLCAAAFAAVAAVIYRFWVASWHVPQRWLQSGATQRSRSRNSLINCRRLLPMSSE